MPAIDTKLEGATQHLARKKLHIYKGYYFASKEKPMTPRKALSSRANRIGQVFGRLTVVEDLGVAPVGYRWWGCVCECGTKVGVRSRELDGGHTRSCGCLWRENLTKKGGRNKLPEGVASLNELYASYVKSATGRGHEWKLDFEQFRDLIAQPCSYCGIAQNKERKPNKGVNGGFMYTGLDRVNNALGYTLENVTPCCWDCNRAKGRLSAFDFKQWMDRLTSHEPKRSAWLATVDIFS